MGLACGARAAALARRIRLLAFGGLGWGSPARLAAFVALRSHSSRRLSARRIAALRSRGGCRLRGVEGIGSEGPPSAPEVRQRRPSPQRTGSSLQLGGSGNYNLHQTQEGNSGIDNPYHRPETGQLTLRTACRMALRFWRFPARSRDPLLFSGTSAAPSSGRARSRGVSAADERGTGEPVHEDGTPHDAAAICSLASAPPAALGEALCWRRLTASLLFSVPSSPPSPLFSSPPRISPSSRSL